MTDTYEVDFDNIDEAIEKLEAAKYLEVAEAIIDKIMERGYDINTKDKEGKTVLYHAVENEKLGMVKLLLSCPEIDVNAEYIVEEEIDGQKYKITSSPLSCVIGRSMSCFPGKYKESLKMVKLLLSCQNLKINNKTMDQYSLTKKTPLFIAVEKNNIDMVRLLLEYEGIDVNTTGEMYETKYPSYKTEISLLYRAIESRNIEIIELLLSRDELNPNLGLKMYKDGYIVADRPVLDKAVERDDQEVIKLLLEDKRTDINVRYLDSNYRSVTPFYMAVGNGDLDTVKLFISRENLDINAEMKYLMSGEERASMINNENLDMDGKIKYIDNAKRVVIRSPVYTAIENWDSEIVKLLFSRKDLNLDKAQGWFGGAIFENKVKAAEFLLSIKDDLHMNIDVNAEIVLNRRNNKVKIAPIHLAVLKNNPGAVRFLLEQPEIKINTKFKDYDGKEKTALELAIEHYTSSEDEIDKNMCNNIIVYLLKKSKIEELEKREKEQIKKLFVEDQDFNEKLTANNLESENNALSKIIEEIENDKEENIDYFDSISTF